MFGALAGNRTLLRRLFGILPAFLFASLCPLAAQSPVDFQVGAFTFVRPEGFVWIPPTSPMRKAELSFPGTEGPAEITFFYFGQGQGGSTQANIQRWLSQFQEPADELQAATASQQVGSISITLLSASGTFLSGMPGQPTTPRPNYALRGAILEHPEGDVYIKMTGPAATVEEASSAFDRMVIDAASAQP